MSAIAIDGPAGAGKSTIAKLLAKQLGYVYVDTGAMYRAMAVYFSQNDINPDDENAINGAVDNIDISIEYKDGVQQVILNGENVTSLLRTEETGKMASKTSKYAEVRTKLVALQRYILLQVLMRELREDMMNLRKKVKTVVLMLSRKILKKETMKICTEQYLL